MPRIQGIDNSGVPVGQILHLGLGTLPPGVLLCDGTSYSTATYPYLFAKIGYTWGGSGSSFNVPDLRGRALIGAGTGSGLTTRTLGTQNIGSETHVLSVSELPSHTHGVSGTTGNDSPDHAHVGNLQNSGGVQSGAPQGGSSGNTFEFGGGGIAQGTSAGANSRHAHSFNATTDSGTGGGSAHTIMQPSAVVTYGIAYI